MRSLNLLFPGSILILGLAAILIFQGSADATEVSERKSLVIVSGSMGYTDHELGKASSFRDYLIEYCTPNDIFYLTDPSDPYSDGPATVSNVMNAFEWLRINSDQETEVCVYIFDHEYVNGDVFFVFDDGNISSTTIDSWLDQVPYSWLTVILNGERSGLAGPDLSSPGRTIICSMGSTQTFEHDIFSIARSLEDPTADTNMDGKVSFVEAYWKEVENLSGTGQDPVLFL